MDDIEDEFPVSKPLSNQEIKVKFRTDLAEQEARIREEDVRGDEAKSYSLRKDFVYKALQWGELERAVTAFAWMRAYFETNLKSMSAHDKKSFCSIYSLILNSMPLIPSITRAQIQEVESEFAKRVIECGFGERAIHGAKWSNMMAMGDFDGIHEYLDQWKRLPDDGLYGCEPCEMNSQIKLHGFLRDDEKALKISKPIFAGRFRCFRVPDATYGEAIFPLIRLKQQSRARKILKEGYERVHTYHPNIVVISPMLVLLAHLGDFSTGFEYIERHTDWLFLGKDLDDKFGYYAAAGAFLERAAEAHATVELKLPGELNFSRDDHCYETADLAQSFLNEADRIATLFDERNQNTFFHERINHARELSQIR